MLSICLNIIRMLKKPKIYINFASKDKIIALKGMIMSVKIEAKDEYFFTKAIAIQNKIKIKHS